MTAPKFRGAAYVEHIRTRLWSGASQGRATVMIGAGFSRNALASSPSAPPFPLLDDYRTALASGLSVKASDTAGRPLDRLADEYEASFGREALNDMITRLIPWRQYQPGTLHTLLLRLPWADVFTTNYDTLLEDTRGTVTDRKYDLVVHADDIPTAAQPRIVKLHGSFPSARPFIFTEEDFRSYPRRFAPFVNLVQQGMMENTLCLLGFSGDDPNFLRWAGWVRDELGPHRPQIYLIGALDLSDGRRRYLEGLGISPVDLAELFPWRDDEDGGKRHRQATEWFLRSLANGEPFDRRRWPRNPVRAEATDLPRQPLPPLDAHPVPEFSPVGVPQVDLAGAFRHARAQRLAYPGWEICPSGKREYLHIGTGGYFGQGLVGEAVAQPSPLDLLIACEGVWQLALTGEPLTPAGVQAIGTLLDRTPLTSPPGNRALVLPAAYSQTDADEPLTWLEVKTAWVELAFAQLVEAREDVHEERFLYWEAALAEVVRGQPDWEARWHWEGVRWAIICLNQREARQRLDRWPSLPSDLFWEARRAAALGEIGQIEEAHRLNLQTLNRIRSAQVPGHLNYRLLSQEGWLMMQARFLSLANRGLDVSEETVNLGRLSRLDFLRQYDCDPWGEVDHLKARAAAATSVLQEPQPSNLDLGWSGPSTGPQTVDPLPALKLFRLCEWAGYPLRVGHVTFNGQELTPALMALSTSALRLGVLTAVRVGNMAALNSLLSRDHVLNMTQEETDVLFALLIRALEQAGQEAVRAGERIRYPEHQFTHRVLQHGSQALSLMILNTSAEQRRTILDLTLRLADLHPIQWDFTLHEPLGLLLRRTLQVMPNPEKAEVVPIIAAFPIPTGSGIIEGRWPEPFSQQNYQEFPPSDFPPLPPALIQRLLASASAASGSERNLALTRLGWLHQLKLLPKPEQQTFARALWRDPDEGGLPTNTPFHGFAFLSLPHPPDTDPQSLFKAAYLRGNTFQPIDGTVPDIQLGETSPIDVISNDLYSLRLAPLAWTSEEVASLLGRLQQWWPGVAQYLLKLPREFVGTGLPQLLLDVLSVVLLKAAGPHAGEVEAFSAEVHQFFQEHGFTVLSARTPLSVEDDPRILLDVLLGADADEISEAAGSAARVLGKILERKDAWEPESNRLQGALLNRVIFRVSPGLAASLYAVAKLAEFGLQIGDEEMRQVCLSLRHLALITSAHPGLPADQQSARGTMRAAASTLAAVLYRTEKSVLQGELASWVEIGRLDPLPEVRRPWSFLKPIEGSEPTG